ncbi:hypothetical protein, partial [Sinorhizobium meliloti]|uniref:hypothetical protein n=1 Tax=Rhizobium meliloti TaxID=382 RepID=UPI003988C637
QRRASYQTRKGRCRTLTAACFCPLIGDDQRKHAVGCAVGIQEIQARRAMRSDKTDQSFNEIIHLAAAAINSR